MTAISSRAWLAVAITIVGSACYKTVPLTTDPPPPQTEVVLDFTTAGAQRLGGLIGDAIVSARGRPLAWASDSITLSMIGTTNSRGGESLWRGERVAIPRDAISRISEKRLDKGRTTLFAIGGVALVFAAQQAISGNSGGTPRPPNIPPGQ